MMAALAMALAFASPSVHAAPAPDSEVVNISEFYGVTSGGTPLRIAYNVTGKGLDGDGPLDVKPIAAPAPGAALGGAALMAALFYIRHRRLRRR